MNLPGLKILLIEDDDGDAVLIAEMLNSLDAEMTVKRAAFLSAALKLLEETVFDVVLLDLGLPDNAGIDAVVKIREKRQELPVIVLTGLSDEELAVRAISLGAQDYLDKGKIDKDIIYRSILYSIERKHAEEIIRRSRELSDSLLYINTLINSMLDTDEIMQMVVVEAARAVGTDGSSIGLVQGGSIFMKYSHNMPEGLRGKSFPLEKVKSLSHVMSVRDAIAFSSGSGNEHINVNFWDAFGIKSHLSSPLIIRGDVIGVISLYCLTCEYLFSDIYIDFARKLSTSISIALENARLHEEQRLMEDKIRHLADHDELTGLPNRRLFGNLLALEIAESRRHGTKMGIFFIDLDRFKDVNDSLGHDAGDELLEEVAGRLKTLVRASDTVARIGGDEFNIIVSNAARVEDVADIARKIVEGFQKAFVIAGHEFHITTSIGISIYPDDSEEVHTLLRYADIAMYNAKKEGRSRYQFYDPRIKVRSIERMKMDTWLRQSVKRGELSVYYQPQVDIASGKIVCAEALVRWRHPEMGLLEASKFIPLAEETGFIDSIDEWVLRTACARARTWEEAGLASLCVTVNLSARQLRSPDLVGKVSDILGETGISPDCLHIEVTESVAMGNIALVSSMLKKLSEMGIHIYVDDFGVGYSSLNYLKRLPVECLKIDKSFIHDIATDPDDRSIISAVTAMAHNMRMKVIAEGVETEEQLSFLRMSGCDEIQGFLFSKPLPADEFELLLARNSAQC